MSDLLCLTDGATDRGPAWKLASRACLSGGGLAAGAQKSRLHFTSTLRKGKLTPWLVGPASFNACVVWMRVHARVGYAVL